MDYGLNMKLLKCPHGPIPMTYFPLKIFLAGGITNCPRWQDDALELSKHLPDNVLLYNPRRDSFDITDPNTTKFQIKWEHTALTQSDAILFWFPKDTLCPITLFELGKFAGKKPIFVGTDLAYARRLDVIEQLSYIDESVNVRYTLDHVIADVTKFVEEYDFDEKVNNDLEELR